MDLLNREAILIQTVRACLHVDNMESKVSLRKALESLIAVRIDTPFALYSNSDEQKHGDKFAVQILQLEALGAEEPLDSQAYLQGEC